MILLALPFLLMMIFLYPERSLAAETDTQITAAGYMGGDGEDLGNAVAIQKHGTVVIAGKFTGLPQGGSTHLLMGAEADAQGALLRLADGGKTLSSVTRLGDSVDDMALMPGTDGILAYGPFGLVLLNSDGREIIWEKSGADIGRVDVSAIYSSGRRVAVAENGEIAIMGNIRNDSNDNIGTVHLFDAEGTPIEAGSFQIPPTEIGGGTYNETWEDIAIDADHQLIFVTGKAQRCSQYQSSFLMAYSYTAGDDFGTQRWKAYTLWCSGAENENLTADARGKRVIYKDGFLYFVGNTDGGNNLFTKDSLDYLSTQTNNIVIDRWNNGAGFGSGKIAYFAKMNPETGAVVKGQFQFSSAGVNQARSFAIEALSVNSDGGLCIGGQSEKEMPLRDQLMLNSSPIGARVDNENAYICVNSDFDERTRVASWTGAADAGASTITAMASLGDMRAIIGETGGSIITVNPVDGEKALDQDVFFSVWGSLTYPNGDFNCSLTIDLHDALATLKLLVGSGETPGDCLGENGDYTGDGVWDLADAIGLLQAVAGLREQ